MGTFGALEEFTTRSVGSCRLLLSLQSLGAYEFRGMGCFSTSKSWTLLLYAML